MAFESIDELEVALREADYLPDRGLATALFLVARGSRSRCSSRARPASARPRRRRRSPAALDRAADPAAVLRGPRRRARRLRVELLAPAAAHPRRAGGHGRRGGAVRPRVPDPPAAAGGDREPTEPVVLLIDEIDRADEEFEAFLLEVLSDFQITIPEIGTIRAARRPRVVLTSNRTRELHDALKRRCLYHWIGHPALEREIEIVRLRVPGVPERLAAQAAAFVARAARARPRQAAGRGRDDRLGARAGGARPAGARRRGRRADARLGAQVPRGPARRPRRGARRPRRGGARLPADARVVRHVVDLRPRAARGRPGGRPGPRRGCAARSRPGRPRAARRRLLDAPPDARLARRRPRAPSTAPSPPGSCARPSSRRRGRRTANVPGAGRTDARDGREEAAEAEGSEQ